MIRANTVVGTLGLLTVLLASATSHGRKPRLRLEHVDHSTCARDGVITAWVAELELEGIMRAPVVDGLRLQLDGKPLPEAPVKVIKFAASARPLYLALVIQTSEAYAIDLKGVTAGAAAMLRALPGRARVAVIQYDAEASSAVAFGPRKQALDALLSLKTTDLPGDVALVSAVKMGLRGLATGPGGRRLLVVVSDGLNESPKRDLFRGIGDRGRKAGIPIHAIAYSPVDERGPLLNLGEIAKRSEGTLRWARRPEALVSEFKNLGNEINDQLGLTFTVPDRCLAQHKVRVTSGRLRSRVVALPRMKPVEQVASKTALSPGGRKEANYTWIAIPVAVVLVLISALVIWFMARRWRASARGTPRASPPPRPQRETETRPRGPRGAETGAPVTGQEPLPVPTDAGVPRTGPRPIPAVDAGDFGLDATGPRPVAPVRPDGPVGPLAGPQQVPFDERPTISPVDPASAQQPIAVMAAAAATLVGCAPPLQGWRVNLPQGEALIGTAPDCLIRLDPSLGVATYHARLNLQAGRLTIEDLESRGGLFVNHQHASQATLASGDVVQVGQAMFQVKIG